MWECLAKINNKIPFNTLLFFVAYSYFKDTCKGISFRISVLVQWSTFSYYILIHRVTQEVH